MKNPGERHEPERTGHRSAHRTEKPGGNTRGGKEGGKKTGRGVVMARRRPVGEHTRPSESPSGDTKEAQRL